MVKHKPNSLDTLFGALSDPTRRHILEQLTRAESSSVTDLARPFAISLPAISRHLRVLEQAGLIARRRDGRIQRVSLQAKRLRDADRWIEQYRRFWETQFDALALYLRKSEPPKNQK